MPDVKLKWEGDTLNPENDDFTDTYTLSRQVAHEYHSSAVQSYIDAESAALQVRQEAAMNEEDKFRREQTRKQAEGKAAASSFAGSMAESVETRTPTATKSKGEGTVAPEGGGGGWGDDTAPDGMPSVAGDVQAETQGLEDPMIDPVTAGAAGSAAAFKLSMSAGKALMPSLARAVSAGVVNVATDPIYGTAADMVGASSPALALPFNIAVGLLGGMTLEPAIERGIAKAAAKAGKTLTPEMLREQAQLMKGILADESGMVDFSRGAGIKSTSKTGGGEMPKKPYEINPWEVSLEEYTPKVAKSKWVPGQVTPGGYVEGHYDVAPGYTDETKLRMNYDEGHVGYFYRAGDLPKGNKSTNYIDNTTLPGVSSYHFPDPTSFAGLKTSKWIYGKGKVVGVGPDGEPLVEPIGKWKTFSENNRNLIPKAWVQHIEDAIKAKKKISAEILEQYYKIKDKIREVDSVTESGMTHKSLIGRESGGQVDDLTKAAVVEEINAEIGKHPVKDALSILKNQKGEVVIKQGAEPPVPTGEGTPPAPVKGKKSGVPAAPDMEQKAGEFTANKNPDITQETAGNIRLWGADLEPKFMGDLETPEDIMRVISGTHEAFADETQIARRGVRSWEETAAEAKKYKIEDLLGRNLGQALNAEQIDNARTLLVSSSDTLRGMATLVRSGQANDLQKADFMRAFNTHYAIQMQLAGAAAEAGRALQIFRKVAQSDALRVGQLKEFLASTADRRITPETIADALSTMESPAQVANYVKQAARATTWDMLIEAWINGLLSGPVTHAVNSVSNAITSMWMIPERALAAGISKTHGGEIRGGEVAAQAYGLVQGSKDGFKLAWHALKTGEGTDLVSKIEQQQQRAITAANVKELPAIKKMAPNALEEGGVAARAVDALGEMVRVPGRLLTAEDEFFKSVGYRMELQAQAFRKAAGEGLEGAEMAKRMQEIIADPQNLAPDVHLAAVNAARYQTFTNELGGAGRAVQSFSNKMPGAKLIIPFIRTPANIMKFALERNVITAPFFKQVRADIMAGGARRDMALAKMSLGSMAMGVVATYAASGMITGGGPSDKDLRSHLYNTGWQPYSIKIGNKYYSYGRLEPIGMMMGLAADAVEIMGELDEGKQDEIATTIVAAIGKNVMSKTWLRGMSEMVHMFDDPGRYGPNYIKQFAGTAVPTGVAQIERTMYPELSDARTALEAIKARVPGYSNDLPTRRNVWGEKITFNGALGPDIISPIYTSEKKRSPIDEEIIRLSKTIPRAPIKMPSRQQSFEGVPVPLDSYEYEELLIRMNGVKLEATGKTLKKSLDELVTKDKDYKAQKNDDIKNRMIEAYTQEALEKAKYDMIEQSQGIRLYVDDEHRRQAAAQ